MRNVDRAVTEGFGLEWRKFDHGAGRPTPDELSKMFSAYFAIFPWEDLPESAVGLDAGCGSGRWANLVIHRAGTLHLIDASRDALAVARQNISSDRAVFHHASVSDIPLPEACLDFAYSLGVLHHVPDTASALRHIASKMKRNAPLLVYLYYALENRPRWYRMAWQATNLLRLMLSRAPHPVKLAISQVIAAMVYFPLAKIAKLTERLGLNPDSIPLETYKNLSLYVMQTDSYDRFCTSLEKRFTRDQIELMLIESGFDRVTFSERAPFWCAVARKT